MNKDKLIDCVSQIVSAYVSKNLVTPDQMQKLIIETYNTFQQLIEIENTIEPAVPIKKSIYPDYIICLEDGKKLQILSRYIKNKYNLTPQEYRNKWNLPHDYPMIAPNYAEKRRQIAKTNGLGNKI